MRSGFCLFRVGGLLVMPILLIGGLAPGARAQTTLRVAVVGSPPFVIDDTDGPTGLSVDVWASVAEVMELDTEFVRAPDVDTALADVTRGEADVAIGPISITAARAESVRFTQPYFGSSLGIVAPASDSLLDRFAPFLTRTFVFGAVGLLTILVLVGTLFWLAERRVNPAHFPEDMTRGVGNGLWMALVTMTTVGYGDRVPVSAAGRILAGGWMFISLVIASSLTAFLTTALTLSQMEGSVISDAEELRGRRVGVVGGTTSEAFVTEYGGRAVVVPDIDAAVAGLAAGTMDAVVFDRPVLRYVLSQNPDLDLRLASSYYQPQNYGFAVRREDQALADRLDRAILGFQASGALAAIEARWLGSLP